MPVIKANPMPHYGVPFKPKMPEQRHVEVCPFSFDSRDRERLIQKEKKIEELQKEEVRAKNYIVFHSWSGKGVAGLAFCCWLWSTQSFMPLRKWQGTLQALSFRCQSSRRYLCLILTVLGCQKRRSKPQLSLSHSIYRSMKGELLSYRAGNSR